MPCETLRDKDGRVVGIACSRGRGRRARPCRFCTTASTKLCDGKMPDGGTCDAPICEGHAMKVGRDLDLCPDCVAAGRRAW